MIIEISKQGEEHVLVLPAEAVVQLGWQHGDVLEGEIADGVLKIVRSKTSHERSMEIAEKAFEEYRETFEALAKS
jgi:antitoxin component of MazEF toxin-antitoxin module